MNLSLMNSYEEVFKEIIKSVDHIDDVKDDTNMRYIDKYMTGEQKKRDKNITQLLDNYVKQYKYRNSSNKWYKNIIFGLCIAILILFCATFTILIFRLQGDNNLTTEGVIQIISVCITFLTLIIGVLKIITKYVFPEKEEEYITRIVEIIQKNDLENKKQNIKAEGRQKKPQDNHIEPLM